MAMEICGDKVMVLCYWNGSIKYGTDGVYYGGGSISRNVTVKRKTKLSRFLDKIYLITGLDKEKSKFVIFGKYPVAVSPHRFTYLNLPVVDDSSLETMLEVPSNHPTIKSVELYLEMISTSALANPGSSLKRQRVQQEMVVTNPTTDVCLNKAVNSGVSKPSLVSSLWVEDDHELRVGMCFKDRDELKKAVDWCSYRGKQRFVARETEKDMCTFECIRSKCNWLLQAARMEEHGLVEIIKYSGPHTCFPIGPEIFDLDFPVEEIEGLIRKQPTLTIAELESWWFEKFGYELEASVLKAAKQKVIKKIHGDWDESFRELPKLMAAFQSSNGLVVDWQYDRFPNPEFASFRGVFWAFPQSIEGFKHCRPLIAVDTKDLKGKYPLKLMVASGLEACGLFFPLAFAITKELSVDSWRCFFTNIREKVTQRKGLCLMSSPHPDILAVVNEPGSMWQEPWAYHRFCLDHLCSQVYDDFKDRILKCKVRSAGSKSKVDEFDSYMEIIKKENPEVLKWLDKFSPHHWVLAHDNGHRRYGIMTIDTNNLFSICESSQPVTATVMLLFDALRLSFHTGHSDSSRRLKRGDLYIKPVMIPIQISTTDTYDVLPLDQGAFQVTYILPLDKGAFQVTWQSEKNKWITQLNERTCTCGEFQMEKYPCPHALAVCKKLKINPLQYVDDCYSIERYYKTYSAKFNRVPEVSAWPEAFGVPTLFPPVIPPPPPNVPDKTKKIPPSDDELRDAIFDIFRKVYYKYARVNDIYKRVAEHFEIDLRPRKPSIIVMIQDEINRLADETEDDDDDGSDEGDEEED